MELGLTGKRVLVTGGSRGIGRAIALAFARAGARVIACHHTASPEAEEVNTQLAAAGGQTMLADVTSAPATRRLAGWCRDEWGGLDVLVNNVGVDGSATLDRLVADEWERVVGTNLTGMFLTTRAALPVLSDGASVVNIGASVAMRGRPGGSHYAASKAAVAGLTRSLAKELGGRGIRVNTVAPGVVEDGAAGPPPELRARLCAMTALGRLGSPHDVAGAVLFLASDLSRYISGTTLTVDGGV